MFTSIEAMRWVLFVRNIDARGWELHFRDPESIGNKNKYLSHGDSFVNVCKAGELEIVKAMVERTPVDLEARVDEDEDEDGKTPLHWAAYRGHLPVVEYLCEHGADKEARDAYGMTPLHFAACSGYLPVVQYLCEQGADMDARGQRGQTPLLMAGNSHLDVAQYQCE